MNMMGHVSTSNGDRPANGATFPARASETVAHGRAHLDYQRRVATAGVHRDDARVVRHDPDRTT